jgi:hypothetical protein
MSTKDLINAIASGDAQQIETTFESVMKDKISVALDAMRSSVAQNLFTEEIDLDEEKTPGVALSKAYNKSFDGKKPGNARPETSLTGAYSKTGKPGGELKKKNVDEEIDLDEEQLDELSKSTLGSYIKKSKSNIIMHGSTLGTDINKRVKDKSAATMQKRAKGINKAVDKLTEEELDEAEEKVKYVSGHGWGPGRVQVTTNKGRKLMVKHEINKDHSYSGPQVGHKMADWEHMKEEIEEGYDSSGAYEKHDPKHPAFVKNYTKFKTANPKGTIGDFVAHMKKQK